MKNLIWYLFAGTKGGITRARIVHFLLDKPANANQVAERLHLDYKTVRHHLDVLDKNKLLYAINKDRYGAVYFPTEQLEANIDIFNEIWDKIGHNLGKNT